MKNIYFHSLANTGSNSYANAIGRSYPTRKVVEITDGFPDVRVGDTKILLGFGEEACIFKGHNLYGLIEKAKLHDKYITILRDPKERVISDFFWGRRLQERSAGFKYSYLQDMESLFNHIYTSNHLNFYIHHLSHVNYVNKKMFDLEECSRLSNSVALQAARKSLSSKFLDVGITEEFDRSLFQLSDKIGLTKISNWIESRHEATPGKPGFTDLPLEIQKMISHKTSEDNELYLEEREKFEKNTSHYISKKYFIDYSNWNNKSNPIDASDHSFDINRFIKSLGILKNDLNVICLGIGSAFLELQKSDAFKNLKITALYDSFKFDYELGGLKVQSMDKIDLQGVDVIFITSARFYMELHNLAMFKRRKFSSGILII